MLMDRGEFEAAANLLGDLVQRHEGNGGEEEDDVPETTTITPMPAIRFVLLTPRHNASVLGDTDRSTYILHRHAMVMIPSICPQQQQQRRPGQDGTADPPQVEMDLDVVRDFISCVLLYNFGLALHLSAIVSPSNFDHKEDCLAQALMAYEVGLTEYGCWNLPSNGRCDRYHSRGVSLNLLQMCLLNNALHIYDQAQSMTNVAPGYSHEMRLEYLNRMSVLWNDTARYLQQLEQGQQELQQPTLQIFLQNITCNQTNTDRQAAAA